MLFTISRRVPKLLLATLLTVTAPSALAEETETPELSASGELTVASKYIWRGQRLTNDWSLQPSGTLSLGGFSFNAWGTLDLTAVNEGDSLPIAVNPEAGPGNNNGLRGKFSEIDLTASFAHSIKDVDIEAGVIFYSFPERSASLPSTTELYWSVSLPQAPLSPTATLYLDVDETIETSGSGLYLSAGGSREIPTRIGRFPVIQLSGELGFANGNFGRYYYGEEISGLHDLHAALAIPVVLGERTRLSLSLHYTSLLRDFRDHQFLDPRDVYRGTGPGPSAVADTVWAGLTLGF